MKHPAHLLLVSLLFSACSASQAAEKPRSLAGWYDLFPNSQRLFPQYDPPIVTKGEGKYSQTVYFDAMTGLPRSFSATVAYDPEFSKVHTPALLKKASAKSVEIGKRTAWVWEGEKKVVIPLGDEKAVIIELDPRSQAMPMVEYAKSLDLDRIEKALSEKPRTDFSVTLKTFQGIKKSDSALGLYGWAGHGPSEVVGKKEDERYRTTYALKDRSKVVVIAAKSKIESVVHETIDGKSVDLIK